MLPLFFYRKVVLMYKFYVYFVGRGEQEDGSFVVYGCYPVGANSPRKAAKKTLIIALKEGYRGIKIRAVYDESFRQIDEKEWQWK